MTNSQSGWEPPPSVPRVAARLMVDDPAPRLLTEGLLASSALEGKSCNKRPVLLLNWVNRFNKNRITEKYMKTTNSNDRDGHRAQDGFLLLSSKSQGIIAGSVTVKPVFPELAESAAPMDAA